MGRKSRLKKEQRESPKEKGILETWKDDVDALMVGAVFYVALILLTSIFR